MLAGRVKLKNFVAVTTALSFLGIGGLVAWWWTRPRPEPTVADPPVAPHAEPSSWAPAGELGANDPRSGDVRADLAPALGSPAHAFLLGQAGRDLGARRIQDASRNTSWKVNLYQDEGNATINRAKIDLDRDDRWDEKWTYHPDGRITRQVSPADDEQYTQRFTWSGTAWVAPGAAAVEGATPPDAPSAEEGLPPSSIPVLAVHRWVLAQAGRNLGADRIQDATRGQAYKVNLYQDDGHAAINRAKIDLDRDDRWDEKWTFHPDGRITRQVSPNDDDRHTDRYVWNGRGWDRE